MKNLCLISSI
jgi:hypothetical protein